MSKRSLRRRRDLAERAPAAGNASGRSARVPGYVFAGLGLVAFSIGLFLSVDRLILVDRWTEASATVTESRVEGSGGRLVARIRVQWSAGGETVETEPTHAYDSLNYARVAEAVERFPAGSLAPLRYDPDNPRRARLEAGFNLQTFGLGLLLLGGGAAFGAVGVLASTSPASTARRVTRILGAQRTRSEPSVEPWLSSWAPSAWSTSVPRSRPRPGRSRTARQARPHREAPEGRGLRPVGPRPPRPNRHPIRRAGLPRLRERRAESTCRPSIGAGRLPTARRWSASWPPSRRRPRPPSGWTPGGPIGSSGPIPGRCCCRGSSSARAFSCPASRCGWAGLPESARLAEVGAQAGGRGLAHDRGQLAPRSRRARRAREPKPESSFRRFAGPMPGMSSSSERIVRLRAHLPVEADREAVRLVAHALDELQHRRACAAARSARRGRARRSAPRAWRARRPAGRRGPAPRAPRPRPRAGPCRRRSGRGRAGPCPPRAGACSAAPPPRASRRSRRARPTRVLIRNLR